MSETRLVRQSSPDSPQESNEQQLAWHRRYLRHVTR